MELVLDDGTVVRSSRPVVAVCACRPSARYPFCDTSHRRQARRADQAEMGATASGASNEERPASQAPRS